MPPVVPGPSLIAIHEGITDLREALARVPVAAAESSSGSSGGEGSERERRQQQEAAWAELRSVRQSVSVCVWKQADPCAHPFHAVAKSYRASHKPPPF